LDFLVDKTDPLEEFVLQGNNPSEKILLLNVDGLISNSPGFTFFGESPSMVEEIVSQLDKASRDTAIKTVILKIDSPGGATTASDIIYHEINLFKAKTNVKIIAMMMDVAASGGYMISLPSDKIMAQPTSVTGSVGVIFLRPKLDGLMDKIGLKMEVSKSGQNKDMGSPFRKDSDEEEKLFSQIINQLNDHFYSLVLSHRKITLENLEKIKSARVFLAGEALELGLIDRIGYIEDAIELCRKEGKLEKNAQLIVYRRKNYPNDNIYNTSQVSAESPMSLINIGFLRNMPSFKAGFYYIWNGTFEM
jgi:protease-4